MALEGKRLIWDEKSKSLYLIIPDQRHIEALSKANINSPWEFHDLAQRIQERFPGITITFTHGSSAGQHIMVLSE